MAPRKSSDLTQRESIGRSTISKDLESVKHIEHRYSQQKSGTTPEYSNRWARYRTYLREPFAEFLGTCILIIFGAGVDCQVVLGGDSRVTSSGKGDYLSINIGWAAGTAMGVWVSGGISGGHINPAVTIALATFRGFPWRKVPIYIFAQVLGGMVGAAVIYASYYHAIDLFEGPGIRTLKTAGLFSTYALDYMTNSSAFFDEFLGTTVLLITVLAMSDKKNLQPPSGLAPLVLFMLVLGIGASLGMQTGYAINPARDLGPRLLTAMVGYGKEVFTFRDHYWIWCPVLGPILGALFGTLVYDTFLFTGEESILNKPNRRSNHVVSNASAAQADPMPAGHSADYTV